VPLEGSGPSAGWLSCWATTSPIPRRPGLRERATGRAACPNHTDFTRRPGTTHRAGGRIQAEQPTRQDGWGVRRDGARPPSLTFSRYERPLAERRRPAWCWTPGGRREQRSRRPSCCRPAGDRAPAPVTAAGPRLLVGRFQPRANGHNRQSTPIGPKESP
jgi:hypothetical protein